MKIQVCFEHIQAFFKKLFSTKEDHTHLSKRQEEYLSIGPNFTNIGFHSKTNDEDWQKEIFEKIKPGHLVYCKMPISDKALKKIQNGHQSRPFLIVKKGKDELYGYACATHPKRLEKFEKHVFKNEVYDSKNDCYKDSVIQFDRAFIIPIACIEYIYKELDFYCIRQIARELQAYANIRNKGVLNFDMEIPILKGDILRINGTYYYFKEQVDNVYQLYPCQNKGTPLDSHFYRYNKIPHCINMHKIYTVPSLNIHNLIEVSNSGRNDWVKRQIPISKIKKQKEQKTYSYKLLPGTIVNNFVYLFDYGNISFGIDYNQFLNHTYKLISFSLDKENANENVLNETQCLDIYNELLKQSNEHSDYVKKCIKSIQSSHVNAYHLEYPVGSVLKERFSDDEYIYLFSTNKKKFGIHIQAKKKSIISIQTLNLDVIDQIRFHTLQEYLYDLQLCSSNFYKSILKDIHSKLTNKDEEYTVSFNQKYPVGTVFTYKYDETQEYMYLYSINRTDYAISLDDASEGVYIVDSILLCDYKLNGELVDEDIIEIVSGICKTTDRLQIYTCTKQLLENKVNGMK